MSAINPALDKFTFRANDKDNSIVDPTSGVLTIDGVDFPLEASPKKLDATDFTHNYAQLFLPNTEHTYTVTLQDMNGNTVTESSTFVTGNYGILTNLMKATDVDTSQPGFLWKIFQNDFGFISNLDAAERALESGEVEDEFGTIFVAENLAWKLEPFGPANGAPTVLGSTPESLVQFEIPGVINVSFLPFNGNGNYPDDEQMPGIPGFNGGFEGAAGEVITYIDFPAGFHTLGVNNAEGFRAQAGFIDSPADQRVFLGESEGPTETTFLVEVKEAGVYPVRFMWYLNIGEPNMELFSIKDDGSIVLLNDTANGGLQTYRVGTVQDFVEPEPEPDPGPDPDPVVPGLVVGAGPEVLNLDGANNAVDTSTDGSNDQSRQNVDITNTETLDAGFYKGTSWSYQAGQTGSVIPYIASANGDGGYQILAVGAQVDVDENGLDVDVTVPFGGSTFELTDGTEVFGGIMNPPGIGSQNPVSTNLGSGGFMDHDNNNDGAFTLPTVGGVV
ncbi:MAG TPA: hypothetical protein EYG38_03445, partial [Verrucomicrobia bacterium]|nr:hypothetical protein [Verrucomicrobiota bacterium]